jgi:protein-S-isoprenylcysteine O-methyltransferase Ste14
MKKRIKMDAALLSLFVIMSGFLFLSRKFYPASMRIDNMLDFLGAMILFKGIMFRMSARGHKKVFSDKSNQLVTSGPYAITRNPMYFGTFLISIGGVLMILPWWCLLIYAWLFYIRFNREMVKEEALLQKRFGQEYEQYCKNTPRIFPSVKKALQVRTRDIFNLKELFSTEEKKLLIFVPVGMIILETFQELVVFGVTNMRMTVNVLGWAAIVFTVIFWILYQKR